MFVRKEGRKEGVAGKGRKRWKDRRKDRGMRVGGGGRRIPLIAECDVRQSKHWREEGGRREREREESLEMDEGEMEKRGEEW